MTMSLDVKQRVDIAWHDVRQVANCLTSTEPLRVGMSGVRRCCVPDVANVPMSATKCARPRWVMWPPARRASAHRCATGSSWTSSAEPSRQGNSSPSLALVAVARAHFSTCLRARPVACSTWGRPSPRATAHWHPPACEAARAAGGACPRGPPDPGGLRPRSTRHSKTSCVHRYGHQYSSNRSGASSVISTISVAKHWQCQPK